MRVDVVALALVMVACGSGSGGVGTPDASDGSDAGSSAGATGGGTDAAGGSPDAGATDAGVADGGTTDGGTTDGGATDAGVGTPAGLPGTANSIRIASGPPRADPEGVAPTPASTSVLTWQDSRGAERTMILGGHLYQYDFSFVGGLPDVSQPSARSAGDDAFGHPGFGYVVSHNTATGNSPLGKGKAPTLVRTTAFSGGHHAVHRVEIVYDRGLEPDGQGIAIPVVIDWFVATGRDHPVWAVTWRTGAAANPQGVSFDTYRMDSRAPYGSLAFDGAASAAAGDAIGGVAWGDFGMRFTTTDAQLTLASPWRYDQTSTVAFTQAWTATVNAEMGIVQTRRGDKEMGYQDRVWGRERGATSATAYQGKGNCADLGDPRLYTLPCVGGWPYQLMNFDWDPGSGKPPGEPTGTKLLAWGTPYGWLGASSFDLFDFSATADGRGDRSYATFIVLGPRCRYDGGGACTQPGDVATTLAAVSALAAASISGVTPGTLVASAPRGPGATQAKALASGYDDTYAVYRLSAEGDRVGFTFTPAADQPVRSPIFVVEGYRSTQPPTVTVGGVPRTVNTGASTSGAFVSLDVEGQRLWVTLNETISTATRITMGP